MEAFEALLTRRSCRSYLDTPVSEEALNKIANAGAAGAVGMGKYPPTFVIISNRDLLSRLSKINAEIMGTTSDPFYGAPSAILVLADAKKPTAVQDGSCSLQNMQVAAHALGLGSCWINRAAETFVREDGKAILSEIGLDKEDLVGIGYCIVGHPAGELKPKTHENRILNIR